MKLEFAQEMDVSWITAGLFGMEWIQTGSFNNCFPHAHKPSQILIRCGVFNLKSNIWFGCYLGPTELKKKYFSSIGNYVQKFVSVSFHLNLMN